MGHKYALIINSDGKEQRHLDNVDRALGVLDNMDYETFVLNPRNPGAKCDQG